MRVLQVTPLLFGDEGAVGGGERYALELARALAECTPTTFVGFGSQPRAYKDGRLAVRVYRPWWQLGSKRLSPIAPQILREIAAADVVHCHQVHTAVADVCVLAGRLLRKPVFLTDHAGGDRNFGRWLRTAERATGLLLVSHHNAREFTLDGPGRHYGQVRVIYGGADTHRFRPGSEQRRRAVLYAGRLLPYKGVHLLLEGVRPDTEVRIVGRPYHEQYVAYLRELARGRPVEFRTNAREQQLIEEYCAASVLAAPSVEKDLYGKVYPKSEILGLVLLEAMACGTPVVCSKIGGMSELVRDGETGFLVPPADARALGERVEYLLDHPEQARQMGQAARRHVLASFAWEHVAHACLEAYRSAVGPRT